MIEKMTIQNFRSFKEKLFTILDELYNTFDDENEQLFFSKKMKEYISIQKELSNYDLSEIPFEEWKGLKIFSYPDDCCDFSKTKANLDFSIIDLDGVGIFHGCNVKNISHIRGFITLDEFDEKTIQDNQDAFLSDIFDFNFKNKYYGRILTIDDIKNLSPKQIEELDNKNGLLHIKDFNIDEVLSSTLSINKLIDLYNYSKEDYDNIMIIMESKYMLFTLDIEDFPSKGITFKEYLDIIKDVDVKDIKNVTYNIIREQIMESPFTSMEEERFPTDFIEQNKELFLKDIDLPDEIKEKYFERRLKMTDVLKYPEAFKNIKIDNFLEYCTAYQSFTDTYGIGILQELAFKHPEVFEYFESNYSTSFLYTEISKLEDPDKALKELVKESLISDPNAIVTTIDDDGKTIYQQPSWLESYDFKIIDNVDDINELKEYNDSLIVISYSDRNFINQMGINNIIRLEEETGFFSNKIKFFSTFTSIFEECVFYYDTYYKEDSTIEGNNNSLSYDEFKNKMANLVNIIRKAGGFKHIEDWSIIENSFEEYPELLLDKDAPYELKRDFYRYGLSLNYVTENSTCIPYLINKDLSKIFSTDLRLKNSPTEETDFIKEYTKRYGNEKLLLLFRDYGSLLVSIVIKSYHNEIDNEEAINKQVSEAVYESITKTKENYISLELNYDFRDKYPELFVDFDSVPELNRREKRSLNNAFYTTREFEYEFIKKYPQLIEALKDKNLHSVFNTIDINENGERRLDTDLIDVYGNEKFLILCSRYGNFLKGMTNSLMDNYIRFRNTYYDLKTSKETTFEEMIDVMDQIVINKAINGEIEYDETSPSFIKEAHPELFLDKGTDEDLEYFFYHWPFHYEMPFIELSYHKDWIATIKEKPIKHFLLKNSDYREQMQHFIDVFGEEKAFKLGIRRAETVEKMIEANNIDIMKKWYDKTGQRFIPDFVIMQNIPIEKADKFLSSARYWSYLMGIKSFSENEETREAMLKLAYTFGVFDNDQRGYKKLIELLTDLPKKLTIQKGKYLEELINQNNYPFSSFNEEISDLLSAMSEEGLIAREELELFVPTSEEIIGKIYKRDGDNSYKLMINTQSYPKTTQALRIIMDENEEYSILSPDKAHQLFGGFNCEYDPDFREFLLKNIDTILTSPKYSTYISSIQRQFSKIKIDNSNRKLTLDLAVSHVLSNKYHDVETGNEKLAEISAIAGYSQEDFMKLQEIYNIGKQRSYSSIPRITGENKKYSYEILRLDDPLALAIGTLTDCCQELNDVAETCMIHSMIDKNGRIFVVRDKVGNIVAQSWVWRNKDVLCFDNIEIPKKPSLELKNNKIWKNKSLVMKYMTYINKQLMN